MRKTRDLVVDAIEVAMVNEIEDLDFKSKETDLLRAINESNKSSLHGIMRRNKNAQQAKILATSASVMRALHRSPEIDSLFQEYKGDKAAPATGSPPSTPEHIPARLTIYAAPPILKLSEKKEPIGKVVVNENTPAQATIVRGGCSQ